MSSNLRLVAATPSKVHAPRPASPRLGLIPADFEPSERARRRFVARAAAWGRSAARLLERLGAELVVEATERGVELRTVALDAARLSLRADRKHLDLSLVLSDAALDAFVAALDGEPTPRSLAALPEQFVVRRPGAHELRASTADLAALRHAAHGARTERQALRIGWRVPRNLALSHAHALEEQLVDALRALALVEGAIVGRAAPARALADESTVERSIVRRVSSPPDLALRTPRLTRARLATTAATRLRLRGTLGRSRVDAEQKFDRGARVRVLAGPFEGKVGVVQALDARGARVLFGLLATRIELADLAPAHAAPAGRAPARRPRPAMATSHRRSS